MYYVTRVLLNTGNKPNAGRVSLAMRVATSSQQTVSYRFGVRIFKLISTRVIKWQYYRSSPVASCSLPIAPG